MHTFMMILACIIILFGFTVGLIGLGLSLADIVCQIKDIIKERKKRKK